MTNKATVTMERESTGKDGTFSRLTRSNGELLYIAEPPWHDNAKNRSCIPPDTYECVPHDSPHFGRCFLLKNVPDRTHVLIHRGNWAGDEEEGRHSDTDGCLLPGMGRKFMRKARNNYPLQDCVTGSGSALGILMADHPKGFLLKIVDGTGGRAGGEV